MIYDLNEPSPMMQTFSQCAGCAGLGMLIAGSVWVFNINHSNHLCPSELYDFCYGFIIAVWSLCGTYAVALLTSNTLALRSSHSPLFGDI
jgi:hypothetical protein